MIAGYRESEQEVIVVVVKYRAWPKANSAKPLYFALVRKATLFVSWTIDIYVSMWLSTSQMLCICWQDSIECLVLWFNMWLWEGLMISSTKAWSMGSVQREWTHVPNNREPT